MKPLYLELQAFGPYVEKQTVDFEKLSTKGMFLITGNTGSGKTTIFDAMTFSLYGGGSGEDSKSKKGRNDLEEWRCTQAPDSLDTIVSFTFKVRDKKYKFTRKWVKKRINFDLELGCVEIDEDGNEIPLFENPKIDLLNKKAEELIGLNKEQFRQVVLLPQGQFERFLTASSGEKEEILKKIFGAEMWSKYSDMFFDIANDRKNKLTEERTQIDISLQDDGFNTIEELKEKLDFLKCEIETLDNDHKLFNGDKKQNNLNDEIKLNEQFNVLHELETKKKTLDSIKEDIDKKREKYVEAEKIEKARKPIVDFEALLKDYSSREDNLNKLNNKLPEAEKEKLSLEFEKENLEKMSQVDELNKIIGNYESKIDTYKTIELIKDDFNTASKEFTLAENNYNSSLKSFEEAKNEAANAKSNFDKAEWEAKEYRDRYFNGIYGEIASSLVEGNKCPICGSVSHPDPAKKLPDSISKDDVDKKEEYSSKLKKDWEAKEGIRLTFESKKEENKKNLDIKQKALTEKESKYNSAKSNLIPDIPTLLDLENAIKLDKDKIDKYNQLLQQKDKAYHEAVNRLTQLNEQINSAKIELDNAAKKRDELKKNLDKIVNECGFEDYISLKEKLIDNEERTKLHEEIVSYDATVKSNEESLYKKAAELSSKKEPDASTFDERQKEINNENDSYNNKKTECKTLLDRLSKKYASLESKEKHYKDNYAEADSDLAFAKKLRGDTGMGLQRYVLAVMFNQVISEANRMLSNVHGGRYKLYRTDEKGAGNKCGLELKVHDNRSPEKEGRSVQMLSGGEKFLVSLSLSIGMSTIAQKSGVQIEALFIDEGFGTLDDKSIDDALAVLDHVRQGSGMIGIISHVSVLEGSISTHLNVIKSDKGSSISLE